ncbi:MAG: TM2 domain-containing protein [Oscillospiraceae bacterium]|nr:TM2 domain-containing protein [Oscillospiraceae bacterium]
MAGILQIFLGAFGIGRFYLGYYKTAIWQIVLSLVTLFIGGAVWGFIDGILILNGNPHTDAFGKALGN